MKCFQCGSVIPQTFLNMRHFRVEWEGMKEWRPGQDRAAMMRADFCSWLCMGTWAMNQHDAMVVTA